MFTIEHLNYAWLQVRAGSRSAGIDDITVDLFASDLNHQLRVLLRQLQQDSYNPSPAKGFYVAKKNGGKRLIGISTVRDRIVQRLILEELYFPLEDTFLDCSYAYRPGRNIQQAVQHLYSYYRYQPKWIIKADIAEFFDNISWALLLTILEGLQLETSLVQLIEGQLKSGIIINGQHLNPGKGVLQGGVLSGALANLYLTEFDRKCLKNGINLVRYGDDFVIACNSFAEANRILDKITAWLGEVYLTIQNDKTDIFTPGDEFIFLGYRFAKGEVYAPPPPPPKRPGEWVVNDSGTPYFRPKQRPLKFKSRPPKACDISKPVSFPRAPISHFWQDFMSTLYVTDQGSYLNVKNQQFHVFYQQELKIKVPVNRVSSIVLFGCCNVSHGAVSMALRRRIPIMYLSQKGRYFGRLQTEGQAKVEYLARQVECSQNPEFTRRQAEAIVRAKLHNSRILLMRLNRRRKSKDENEILVIKKAVNELDVLMSKLPFADNMDMLRGYEGRAATVYFQALGSLFSGSFNFEKRTKRPPTDPINSMLSLGYTLLSQNVFSFVQTIGLHTHFGNLHVPRDNHPALVSDLVEEWRVSIDSLVVYLVNSEIFEIDDFTYPDERKGVYFQPHALKKFLKHWEEKLQSELTHPHTKQKVAYRRAIELQVREYISCLKGEVETYRPIIWER